MNMHRHFSYRPTSFMKGTCLPYKTLSFIRSPASARKLHTSFRLRAGPEIEDEALPEYKSEEQLKSEKAEELRKAEKFMVIGEGNATCSSCGYQYEAVKGDPDFPVAPGTKFRDTPDDYQCPLCGAPKDKFRSSAQTIPGFAVNQGYGFGANAWTGGQKQLIIYGALAVFFALFLAGYLLD